MKKFILIFALAFALLGCGGGADAGSFGGTVPQSFFNMNLTGDTSINGIILVSHVKPVVASGFGAGASIANASGTAAFEIIIPTGGTNSIGTVTMPPAPHSWLCSVVNPLFTAGTLIEETSTSTNYVTFGVFTISTGAFTTFASMTIHVTCMGY